MRAVAKCNQRIIINDSHISAKVQTFREIRVPKTPIAAFLPVFRYEFL